MRVKKSIINEGQIPISSCYATRVRAEGCHKTPRSALPKERSRLCACEERRVKRTDIIKAEQDAADEHSGAAERRRKEEEEESRRQ